MTKEFFRATVGISVIITHAFCFFIIFFQKDEYLSKSQQIDVSLLFMPITAAYVVAIVRSAIENSAPSNLTRHVNLNYSLVLLIITIVTLAGLIWTVLTLTGNTETDRQKIVIFEIAFGAAFGLIAADLFGKVEKVEVPTISEGD